MTFEPIGNELSLQPSVLCESTATATADSVDTLELDAALEELVAGSEQLVMSSLSERIQLIEAVRQNVVRVAREWVDRSAAIKQIEPTNHLRSEEILSGPVATARYLHLLGRSLREISTTGRPRLPGRICRGVDGRLLVPVAPVAGLFDRLAFMGFRVRARMRAGISPSTLMKYIARRFQRSHSQRGPRVTLVLGAGNISSVPVLDACDHIFARNEAVLLKLHPLHKPLQPIFERLLAPLIDLGCLRIISGDAETGSRAVTHPSVDAIHVTGGVETHDAIVWGPPGPENDERRRFDRPLLEKPVSAELGNVSPWIIIPGQYTNRQLEYQAENVASSVINNAGCNCVATRVLVTWRGWSQRDRFVDRVAEVLNNAEPRDAWYPGATERFEEFAGQTPVGDRLQATVVRDVNPESDSPFFAREPFTCVLAEVGLEAETPEKFCSRAVDFCNNTLWGTLSATLTVPSRQKRGLAARKRLDRLIASLKYGMVGINQWVGLNYVLASPPWGGHPDSTRGDVQSGNARVHNTFLLDGVDQVVMDGPLTSFPRPAWFPSHRNPEPLSWALLDLYDRPGWKTLWRLARCT